MSFLTAAVGKYGAYIWPAYAFSAAVFAWMILDTLLRSARFRRAAERRGEDPSP